MKFKLAVLLFVISSSILKAGVTPISYKDQQKMWIEKNQSQSSRAQLTAQIKLAYENNQLDRYRALKKQIEAQGGSVRETDSGIKVMWRSI